MKCPSGKNERPQHRAGALVDDAHPGDHLSRGQALLLGRIDLPHFVHPAGTPATKLVPLFPPGRRRHLSLLAQPSLQGAFAGDLKLRKQMSQLQPQSSRSPTGMLLAQFQCSPTEGILFMVPMGTASVISRLNGLRASSTPLLQQVPHGALGQLKLLGDLDRRLSVLGPVPNRFSNSRWDSAGHDHPPWIQ